MKKNLNRTALALAIGGVLSASAHADITDIIISEYVEGSSYNKAIELTNTGEGSYTFPANIDLQHSQYVQVLNESSTNVLTGVTIGADETLVIVNTAATDILDVLPTSVNVIKAPNLEFNGNDLVVLIDNTNATIYDVVGLNSDSNWGKDLTFRRLVVDNTKPSQSSTYVESEWESVAKNSFDDLGITPYGEGAEPSDPTDPTDPAEPAEPAGCEYSDSYKTIAEVQGYGATSPLIEIENYDATASYKSTETYNVDGIVTATTSLPVAGFYMQDITADGIPETSDGIFVETSKATSSMVGYTVCVSSQIAESKGLTHLEASTWAISSGTTTVPEATDIAMIEADAGSFNATLERYEGMLVNLPEDIDENVDGNQDMRITQTYGYNYTFGRNLLIAAYTRPNINPTQENAPGSAAAKAAVAENDDYRLVIESSTEAGNAELPYYPDFRGTPEDNYIRIDDSLIGVQGALTYSDGNFSLVVTNELTSQNFEHNNDRSWSPDLNTTTDDGSFAITIGTKNLLNFFNSPFGGDANTHGENRGATTDEEYVRQLAKLVKAIIALDADIVGLMEVENNGFGSGSAIQALVESINAGYYKEDPIDEDHWASISNSYVFVGYDKNGDMVLDADDSIGSDAITTGLLYRPTKVSLDNMRIISMPEQHAPAVVNDNNMIVKTTDGEVLESGDNYQRETLAATFHVNNTGKTLTVAVNHFKSKGSTCWEEWDGVEFGDATEWDSYGAPDEDLQSSCENLRVAAAVQLGEELEDIGGDRIIVGDLNSYGQEDPLLVLTENTTGKTITTARDTFIGSKPQFNIDGAPKTVTKSYGYTNAVHSKDQEKGIASWSYAYDALIGSLDHILISQDLNDRLIDATEWHINAAESSVYDYSFQYKDDNAWDDVFENPFYEETSYRSSDHDSAIMSLSYKYGEVEAGNPVYLTIDSGVVTIPYSLSGSDELVKVGDVAQINLSSELDLNDIVLPSVAVTEYAQSLIEFDISGLEAGIYTATLTLTRDGGVLDGFTQKMRFEAVKQDSTTATVAPVEEYDGSGGGSFGIFGLLSLLGLGFSRRTKIA